jgi:MtN3 and saliva related transmembrane protein
MGSYWIGILGTAGTVLSTVSLLPQVLHTWRTRSAADISAAWLVAAMLAMLIWVIYGYLIDAQALIWTNGLCFVQCAYLLFMKLQTRVVATAERI